MIDNNSTDDTRAVVESFAASRHRPRHVFESRQGLDHARNRGLSEANGDVILYADDDILVRPDWVRQMALPFSTDTGRRIGCVGGEVVPVFPEGRPDWIAGWHAPLAFRADAGPVPPGQSPMGANLAIPRRVFDAVGPWAAGLDRKGQNLFGGGDAEIVRRIRSAGYEIWFAPAAAVRHQMPALRTTFRYAARHAFDSARSRVADRTRSGGATGYLLSRLLSNALKAPALGLLGVVFLILMLPGRARQAWVRSWRSCGYVTQSARALLGRG